MQKMKLLSINDIEISKANFHTHTKRCKHANGEDAEYVEAAIKAGYKVLGFSDHAPYNFKTEYVSPIRMTMSELEEYVYNIEKMKRAYKNEIAIYCGLEMEYFPSLFEDTLSEISQYPLDYLLLGQHYFDNEVGYIHVGRAWDDEEHLKVYIERLISAIEKDLFLYVAHPDIINFTGSTKIYEKYMKILLDVMKKKELPIEININGLRDKIHYPNQEFIKLAANQNLKFIIGVDAHSPEELLDYETYKSAVKMIENVNGEILNKIQLLE